MHIIMAPTCFGLRPSSGSLYRACSLHNKQHTRDFTTCCHISTRYTTT